MTLGVPAAAGVLGFQSAGVATGSLAAGVQGPAVAAGSIFASLQSIGATGAISFTLKAIGRGIDVYIYLSDKLCH